jgi:hypothetical protein
MNGPATAGPFIVFTVPVGSSVIPDRRRVDVLRGFVPHHRPSRTSDVTGVKHAWRCFDPSDRMVRPHPRQLLGMHAASTGKNPRGDGVVAVKRIIGTDVLLVAVGTALVLSACSTETSGTKTDQSANAAADSSPPAASALEPGAAAEPDDGRANTPDAEAKQPPPDPDYCASKDLSLALGEAEGAAGTVYRPLKFTNVSDFPCVLHGFPGVSYVAGEDGHQVGKAGDAHGPEGSGSDTAAGRSRTRRRGIHPGGQFRPRGVSADGGAWTADLPTEGDRVPVRGDSRHRLRQRRASGQPTHGGFDRTGRGWSLNGTGESTSSPASPCAVSPRPG